MNISLKSALELIKNSNGRFFTVGFTKRHSIEFRQMNCQYSKEAKTNKKAKKDDGLLLVETRYGYRYVNISGLRWIKLDGNIYNITS